MLSLYKMSYKEGPMQESPLSFKIILLGDSDIGKTCFINQFIKNQFPRHSKPTISVDFVTKTYQVDDFSVRLNIFDTAGQERYRALTKAYFKGADAVLFMYAMDNKQSFQSVVNWIKYFEKESQSRDELRVLVGTKRDLLPESRAEEEKDQESISKDEVKQLVQTYHFIFKFQTSAISNLNINVVFEQLSRNLIYNSIKRKKSANLIRESQWSMILKRDKQHLLRDEQKSSNCC